MSKSLFITGAAMGIGKSISELFIEKGWSVGILDINKQALDETIEALGENAHGYVGSVTNDEDVSNALKSFTNLHNGKLKLLINNAGILKTGEFDEMDFTDNEAVVEINLLGLLRTTKLALPYLKNAGNSKIINLGSISALTGVPRLETYAATKSAVKSLTESFSMSFKKYNIAVTSLMPHLVNTNMVEGNLVALGIEKPTKAKLTPEQVAAAAWKAYNGNRIHYPISLDAWASYNVSGIMPIKWAMRIVKYLVKY